MLHVDGVTFSYGAHTVLAGCSAAVAPGEVVGLIGRNGAGKSTLMKLIIGQLNLGRGAIRVGGETPDSSKARLATLFAASNDYLPAFVTGYEYLNLLSSLYQLPAPRSDIDTYLERYGMAGRGGHLIEDYSHGMRKKLQLIAAFIFHRPLTLIDETLNGIDVDAALATQDDVRSLAESGGAVLLCSHDFSYLEKVCHRVIMLDCGAIVDEVRADTYASRPGFLESWARSLIAADNPEEENLWVPSAN